MATANTKILVLGGGYGGIMAAVRLAGKTRRLNTDITLISALDYFVERPRLHERATGTDLKAKPITHMLRGTRVRFLQGWITAIDPAQKQVSVQAKTGEQTLAYDYMIYALGSQVDRSTIPGVRDYAYTLDPYGERTTDALEAKLASFGDRPFRAIVVGGGATGVEMATQLRSRFPKSDISIYTQGAIGAFKGERVQKHMISALTEQSISLHEQTPVQSVQADGIMTEAGFVPGDVIIWAGGFIAPSLAREAGIRVNERNQIVANPYLQSYSHPEIYAVGDSAYSLEEPGVPVRMALMPALVSGAQAADNLIAQLRGKSPRPFSFVWYGQGISLGDRDAVGFNAYPADKPVGIIFRRVPAVNIRNFFVWFLGAALELERRFPGFLWWNGKGRYAQQKRRQERRERQKDTVSEAA